MSDSSSEDNAVSRTQDPRPKLRHYFRQLGSAQIPSALHLLVWTRELLEYGNRYPIARLYGNWCVHTRITGSGAGYELLGRINRHFAAISDPSLRNDMHLTTPFATLIARELSTSVLRTELRELFKAESIQAPFLDSHSEWNSLLANVFDEIRGKPIQYPVGEQAGWPRAVRSAFEATRGMSVSAFTDARSFVCQFLVQIIHVPERDLDPSAGRLYALCVTEQNLTIRTEIHAERLEDRSAFDRE